MCVVFVVMVKWINVIGVVVFQYYCMEVFVGEIDVGECMFVVQVFVQEGLYIGELLGQARCYNG